ncbi:fatty acid elongase 3 [Cladophialophora psammophila CBS 110553]|uniref:Elongation of fatty acids protein n=1 Tax=Cladophialophora psammophila CBS 110553 TaxID=1182543 RepID=W9WM24_9EURO|nr:fatty acid elongase 3 [Cladophialophora psammophila CBS 110553]EXJ59489.1 fatty acid elongase 3 [Cladophialophora psammophila CBS 110553]
MKFLNSTYWATATPLPKWQDTIVVSPAITKVDPWSTFDRFFSTITGASTKDFRFEPGQTPMSTFEETAAFILVYYVIIFGGRELMRNQAPMKLNNLFIIHNFYLTAISGALLLLFAQQLVPALWRNGLYDGICGEAGWSQQLLVLYYLNYLTKYLELLDTVFLVLKKKPLTFLHTYHHGATVLLCYTQLVGRTSVSWVPITLNLAVHVIMYWYYAQSARGVKVWWKQYITMFQITQFVLDLGFIYFACYTYFADSYAPWLPHSGSCGDAQQEVAAITGCAIISSYLVLFIMFYFSTYKKPSVKKALKKAAKTGLPTVSETTELTADFLKMATTAIVETTSN